MKKLLKLLPIVVFVTAAFAQTPVPQATPSTPTASNTAVNTANPNDAVIKYQEFLRDEARLHREYTQAYYDTIWKSLGLIVIGIGAVLTWLNWKSKKDIQDQINANFKATFQSVVDQKLAQVDTLIAEGKEKSAKQFEDIGTIILELSAKSKVIGAEIKAELKKEAVANVEDLKGKSILWVDNFPKNNGYPVSVLEKAGVSVSLALDTAEAIEGLQKFKYDLIISDMGRRGNPSAGLDLLKECKDLKIETPVIIYASSKALDAYGKKAEELGAVATTAEVTGVLNLVQKYLAGQNQK
jgi:CheY-like chemotaxis protein